MLKKNLYYNEFGHAAFKDVKENRELSPTDIKIIKEAVYPGPGPEVF